MSDTPIYDQLVIDHREANAAGDLQEGRDLVAAIYYRQGALPPAPADPPKRGGVIALMSGMFR